MADLKERALAKWHGYTPKEKRIIIIITAGIGAIIFYFYYWQALQNANVLLRQQVMASRQELQWVQSQERLLAGQMPSAGNKSIPVVKQLSLLQRKIKAANFPSSAVQLKQINKNTIEIVFQKINFDKMLGLLNDVLTTQGLNISTFIVTSIDQRTGVVTCNVELSTQPLH